MLDGLKSVPWDRLTCSYGTAQAVPGWLRTLMSPSAKMRAAAHWQLGEAFVHQGTVWSATVAAVPFFIELLGSPDIGGKDDILTLLSVIADGSYSGFDASNAAAGKANSANADGADDASQPQRSAIRAGLLVYQALIDDPDPRVRVTAAKLLVQCQSATFDPRPLLDAASAREADAGVRTGLLLARASAERDPAERIAILTAAMRSVETAEERAAAAMTLANICLGLYYEGDPAGDGAPVGELPDDARALLIDALTHPSRRVEKAFALATRGRGLAWSIGMALRNLPAERLRFAAPQLMSCLPRIGRERVHAAAELLLRAYFVPTNGVMLPLDRLDAAQRAALDALFKTEFFWRGGWLLFARLADFGLPASRPLLADYLGRPLPPQDELGAVAQPQPHRPAPFTLKAYETRIRDLYGHLRIKRKKGYRFERRADVDLYSPNGHYRFFFPKTTDAVLAMEREVALLGSLPRLPLMRWRPADSSRDTRAIGRAFMGGLREGGAPLTRDVLERLRDTNRYQQFATLMARFLRELHAVPLDTLRVTLPALHTRSAWEQLYADARARVFDVVPRDARQRIAGRIEPFLADERNWTWTPTLIHGEFVPRNILYFSTIRGDVALSAVTGFRHAGVGDPAYDLATLLGPEGYGEEFVRLFEGAYPQLDEEAPRARFYTAALALRAALTAMNTADQEAFDRAIATILE